ncbi:ABC transporter permease [Marinobacter litoralis]|uniref:ABC transporter permease n=1 Tax=Marinobacter litoralis TaxID=187981 RepID=UPI0018EB1421|nr:ABC transporter permease [Marinobacter litoralis]MBJ6136799.1 ABC transporter permease [Marinobacter litoralis]
MTINIYRHCLMGVLRREFSRFWQQRNRFATAVIRPVLWLFVFATGFGVTAENNTAESLDAVASYKAYLVPGLCGMVILFNSMQCALSMAYDRELGSMRALLVSPLPRPFLLSAKLFAICTVSMMQVFVFLAIATLAGTGPSWLGYLASMPTMIMTGFMLGAAGLLIATWIKQLENFAGVMNFVIFPVFFLSSALYPLAPMRDASPWLYWACQINPFTHAVEAIRRSFSLQWDPLTFGITAGTAVFLAVLATTSFRPQRTRILPGPGT